MNKTPPKKRQRPEEAIQKAVVAFCRAKQANVPGLEYLYHVPNGGKRTKAEARIFKAMGQQAGVSDLHLPVRCQLNPDYIGLWIEMKAHGETTTKSQDDWLAGMQSEGHYCCISTSISHALKTISWYMNVDWSHEIQQIEQQEANSKSRKSVR